MLLGGAKQPVYCSAQRLFQAALLCFCPQERLWRGVDSMAGDRIEAGGADSASGGVRRPLPGWRFTHPGNRRKARRPDAAVRGSCLTYDVSGRMVYGTGAAHYSGTKRMVALANCRITEYNPSIQYQWLPNGIPVTELHSAQRSFDLWALFLFSEAFGPKNRYWAQGHKERGKQMLSALLFNILPGGRPA